MRDLCPRKGMVFWPRADEHPLHSSRAPESQALSATRRMAGLHHHMEHVCMGLASPQSAPLHSVSLSLTATQELGGHSHYSYQSITDRETEAQRG